jgi:predicted 3-demethylubiquinone-9 3-methyltransferase (glyoxalase superfamily)
MAVVTPFLWFDGRAAEAKAHYDSVFHPHGTPASDDGPGLSVQLPGCELLLFDGGPHHEFNDAISLFVSVDTQDELDRLWEGLGAGGAPVQCGWLHDRFGVRWQIVPSLLGTLLGDSDRERAGRVHQAMLGMVKLDIAGLQAAYDG